MEGSPSDTDASSDKKGEAKKDKKTETAFGLGKSTFEFTNKKDKAEKIAEAPLWEKLIPKDGSLAPSPENTKDQGETAPTPEAAVVAKDNSESSNENLTTETHEEAADPTIESLSEGERAAVAAEYAQTKRTELEAGRHEAEDPAAAAEREANITYLEHLEEQAGATPIESELNDLSPVEQPVESTETITEAEPVLTADPETSAESTDPAPAEFEHGQEVNLSNEQQAEVSAQPNDANPPTQQTGPSTFAFRNQNRDPNLEAASDPADIAEPQPAVRTVPPAGGPNFNAAPAAADPDIAPSTRVEYVRDRRREGGYFLAGGIIGYLIGRRRGRIKTEKRLKVVSDKLERQVAEVRQQVVRQETIVRQQARENYNLTHAPAQTPRTAETVTSPNREPARRETISRLTTAEVAANQQQAAERLGITPVEAKATAERIQHFDHREVLAIAERISFDGTSLRTIYESKQITEPGLRRITREFLRGGDIKAALKQEIQVKEMQYERDPQLRDRLAASYDSVDAARPQGSREAMSDLLQHDAKPSTSEPRRNDSHDKAAEKAQAAKDRTRQTLVSAWYVLVVVLVVAAVILVIR